MLSLNSLLDITRRKPQTLKPTMSKSLKNVVVLVVRVRFQGNYSDKYIHLIGVITKQCYEIVRPLCSCTARHWDPPCTSTSVVYFQNSPCQRLNPKHERRKPKTFPVTRNALNHNRLHPPKPWSNPEIHTKTLKPEALSPKP